MMASTSSSLSVTTTATTSSSSSLADSMKASTVFHQDEISTQVMMMPPPPPQPPQPQTSSSVPKLRRGTKRSDHDEDSGSGGDRTPEQQASAASFVINNKKKSVAFEEDPILEIDDEDNHGDNDERRSSPLNSRNSIFQRHVAQLASSATRATSTSHQRRHHGQQLASSQQQKQQQQAYLTHLSPKWPGETGNGQHHLDVRPMVFHDLLYKHRIVIPLFQRRYCWNKKQIYQWYHDVVVAAIGDGGNSSSMSSSTSTSTSSSLPLELGGSSSSGRNKGGGELSSVHRTHKTMFKRDSKKNYSNNDEYYNHDTLICIDGQQRITTIMLFLCALRTECRKLLLLLVPIQNNSTTTSSSGNVESSHQMKTKIMNLIDEIDDILLLKTNFESDETSSMKRWANGQATQLINDHGNDLSQRSVDGSGGSRDVESTSSSTWTIKEFPVGWLPPSNSSGGENKKKQNIDYVYESSRSSSSSRGENNDEDDGCESSSSFSFHPTLIPSYIDRGPFFEILTKDYIQESIEQQLHDTSTNIQKPTIEVSTKCRKSNQYLAYSIFQRELRALIRRSTTTSSSELPCQTTATTFKLLHKLFRKQLYGFSLMYIELLGRNDTTNMQQIFLWMQEKTIFGMGRLLYNPHPGIDFAPIDLARNLVVSCAMNEPLDTQMEFYKQCWIIPLELRFKGSADVLGNILIHFVKRIVATSTHNRYIGDMEHKLEQFKLAVPPKLHDMFRDDNPMMIYAKFHSYVQQRAIEMYNARNSSSMIITDDTTTMVTNPNSIITKDVADSIVQELVQEGIRMGL